MPDQHILMVLQKGSEVWNRWRQALSNANPNTVFLDLSEADLRNVNLSQADLQGTYLKEADLRNVNLSKANLQGAYLQGANLSEADLSKADLRRATLWEAEISAANLSEANLSGADLHKAHLTGTNFEKAHLIGASLNEANLSGAILNGAILNGANLGRAFLWGAHFTGAFLWGTNLSFANLYGADLTGADLTGANLGVASLVRTNFTKATLNNCLIYGASVWGTILHEAKQNNLTITPEYEPTITVDNLKVAQFIYLLLENEEIRDVIDTIAKKAVLILGRFTPERKAVLDALREALRTNGYLPILFDFEKPSSRNFTETVKTLAHLSRFIIADLTDPASIPQELYAIVPTLAVPIQPILEVSQKEYSMFDDLKRMYHWVLPTYRYTDLSALLTSLPTHLIAPAEQKADELSKR